MSTQTEIPKDIHVALKQGNNHHLGRIAILTTDGTEDTEFFYPYYSFLEKGYDVDVLTPDGGALKCKNGAGLSDTKALNSAAPDNYALLYIPGGKAPSKLKKNDEAVKFVREYCLTDKPVAAICHGAQLLAEASVIKGRNIAAWPEVQKEIQKAGGFFVNRSSVRDGQFITARWPGDLPAFMIAVSQELEFKGNITQLAAE